MQNNVKPVISLLTIGLFLLFALASFGPDASTNTTVAIKDCKPKPQVSGFLRVNISYKDKSGGDPIQGVGGRIFIANQTVIDEEDCEFETISSTHHFLTGSDGTYSYVGDEYFHDNAQDLHRIEIVFEKNAFFEEYRPPVQVEKYNSATFHFNCVGKRLNAL